MNKRLCARAAVLGVVLALTVSGLFAAGASAGSKPKGTPVELMTIGPTNAPEFSLPSIPVGVQAEVNNINKAGGLDGHPVKLIVCNDLNSPDTAIACARQAITDKVVAVVGGLSGSDLQLDPYLKQAGIPWIGESTPDDFTDSNMWVIGNDGLTGYVAIGTALAHLGCTKVGIVLSAEGAPSFGALIAAGVAASGNAKVVGTYQASATDPNWASYVSAARAGGADCIGAGTGPPETPGLIAAMNASAGPKMKLVLLEGGLPSTLITQLGAAASGVYAVAGFLPFTSHTGAIQTLKKEATAIAPSIPLDTFTETGYAATEVVAHAAKGLKTLTAATLTKALSKVKKFNTGLGPVVTLTKPGSVSVKYPRLFNPYEYIWVVKNGNTVLAQPKPINLTAALKTLG